MNYLYKDLSDIDAARQTYDTLGFCMFTDLLPQAEFEALRAGLDEALAAGRISIREQGALAVNDDAIYAHPAAEEICKHPALVEAASTLMGHIIELQHAKFNAKPKRDTTGEGEVKWHQDFPYFPHTNYDLIACVIHLDDEDEGSGALEFIPGSHKEGERSHLSANGDFAYYATEAVEDAKAELLLARRGWVSFHHCLTLHHSAPKTHDRDRRFLVLQYRATDAVQLAGPIWKCNGYKVDPREEPQQWARFPDGTRISLRGNNGRLYDLYSALKPNTPPKNYG